MVGEGEPQNNSSPQNGPEFIIDPKEWPSLNISRRYRLIPHGSKPLTEEKIHRFNSGLPKQMEMFDIMRRWEEKNPRQDIDKNNS